MDTHGIHGQSRAEPPALFNSDDESLSSLSSNEDKSSTEKREIVPTLARECSSSSDDESVGGKPRHDQQRRRREQDQKTGRNREKKGNQTQRRDGFNDENRSPNTSSAAPTGRGSQSLPTHSTSRMNIPLQSGTTQAWSPQTTYAPTSLRQVWDASSHFGTAQARGRGIQRNKPTDGAYSSAQSPRHPGYIQQTHQRSARDRGHGAQYNSQAQAKDRSGTIPVGKMGATAWFS